MCLEFTYLKCKCGKIYFNGKKSISCGHSGFKGEDDGTQCYQCGDRHFLYNLIDDYLIKCPQCQKMTEYNKIKPSSLNVGQDKIIELNGGKIPPTHQTLQFVEHIFEKNPNVKFDF